MGRRSAGKRIPKQGSSGWDGLMVHTGATSPSRSTIAASEIAAEDDRLWFDAHPREHIRVREAFAGEIDQRLRDDGFWPLPANHRVAVVVLQSAPGTRTRLQFCAFDTGNPDQPLELTHLAEARRLWDSQPADALPDLSLFMSLGRRRAYGSFVP